MDLYRIIVAECARHGGPTERCQRIYRNLEGSRSWYWKAVQEGCNRYWWRCKRRDDCKAVLQEMQLTGRDG